MAFLGNHGTLPYFSWNLRKHGLIILCLKSTRMLGPFLKQETHKTLRFSDKKMAPLSFIINQSSLIWQVLSLKETTTMGPGGIPRPKGTTLGSVQPSGSVKLFPLNTSFSAKVDGSERRQRGRFEVATIIFPSLQ